MTSHAAFLSLFEFEQGQLHSNYELASIELQILYSETLNEYRYPLLLWFNYVGSTAPNTQTVRVLYDHLLEYTEGVRVLAATSTRPLKCVISWPLDTLPSYSVQDNGARVAFTFEGRSRRISIREARALEEGRQLGW